METKAIIQKAGGVVKVAKALGLSHSTICGWKRVPPRHTVGVATLAGMLPHQIRPDVFPAPPMEHKGEAA